VDVNYKQETKLLGLHLCI